MFSSDQIRLLSLASSRLNEVLEFLHNQEKLKQKFDHNKYESLVNAINSSVGELYQQVVKSQDDICDGSAKTTPYLDDETAVGSSTCEVG